MGIDPELVSARHEEQYKALNDDMTLRSKIDRMLEKIKNANKQHQGRIFEQQTCAW